MVRRPVESRSFALTTTVGPLEGLEALHGDAEGVGVGADDGEHEPALAVGRWP
jgi:hypothetical protein